MCICAKSLQSCLTLCDSMNCSPPGRSVHGILQARISEWIAIPFFRGSSWPRDWTWVSCISCIVGRFFITEPPAKPLHLSRALNFFFYFSCWTAADFIWSQDIVDGRKLIVNLSCFSIPWWAVQKESFLYHSLWNDSFCKTRYCVCVPILPASVLFSIILIVLELYLPVKHRV